MENVEKNILGDRKKDSVSFQKAFVPSYRQMLESMMCDVLAGVYGKNSHHFVIRRPVWVDGVKKFQYGHLKVPHDASYGIGRYVVAMNVDSATMWDIVYDIYVELKKAMFDSLSNKDYVKRSVFLTINEEEEANGHVLPDSWMAFEKKVRSALDKK
jgi:hypothetical protein